MDSYDFHIAQQKTKDRTIYIAITVFIVILLLLIALCVLIKYTFDHKEKKTKPSTRFDINKIVPDIEFPFSDEV